MNTTALTNFVGNATYGALALVALWGAFCAIVVWRRINQCRFRTEEAQNTFLAQVEENLNGNNFDAVVDQCQGDRRVIPQLVMLAVANRNLGYNKLRALVADRFRRDILSDLEYRLSWVSTVIKTAPMLGLFGTVLGMMGAFDQLASGEKVDPKVLASNISLALITTAIGLTIAIPLIMAVASINVQMRKMEDLVGQGLTTFFDLLKGVIPGAGGGR